MSYTDAWGVGDVSGFTFTSTSSPVNLSQVTGFIEQIEAEMRAALSAGGYDPDTTDTDAAHILRLYCSMGSAALVLGAGKRPDDAAPFQRRYEEWLALVREGKAGLPALGVGSALPSSYYTRSPGTYPEPAFRRGEVQW